MRARAAIEQLIHEDPDQCFLPDGRTALIFSRGDPITFEASGKNSVLYADRWKLGVRCLTHSDIRMAVEHDEWDRLGIYVRGGGKVTPQLQKQLRYWYVWGDRGSAKFSGRLWKHVRWKAGNATVISFWQSQREVKRGAELLSGFLQSIGVDPQSVFMQFLGTRDFLSWADFMGRAYREPHAYALRKLQAVKHVPLVKPAFGKQGAGSLKAGVLATQAGVKTPAAYHNLVSQESLIEADEKFIDLPTRLHVSNLKLALTARGQVKSKKKETDAELRVDIQPLLIKLGIRPGVEALRKLAKENFYAPIWRSLESTIHPPANKRAAWKVSGGGEAAKRLLTKSYTSTELLKLICTAADPEDDWVSGILALAHGRRLS